MNHVMIEDNEEISILIGDSDYIIDPNWMPRTNCHVLADLIKNTGIFVVYDDDDDDDIYCCSKYVRKESFKMQPGW